MALAFPLPVADRPQLRLVEGGRSGSARPVRAAAPAPTSAVVYRRRRVAVAAVAAVLVGSVASLASSLVGGATPADTTYLVAAGQSLWQVAAEVSPHANRLEVVGLLAEANGGSTTVRAGQRLLVPGEVIDLAG